MVGRAGLDGGAATRYDVHMTQKQKDSATNFLIGMALLFTCALLWGALAAGNGFTCDTGDVVVQYGDSLWSIAEAHCDGNIRSAVDSMANDPSTLQPGDVVRLP